MSQYIPKCELFREISLTALVSGDHAPVTQIRPGQLLRSQGARGWPGPGVTPHCCCALGYTGDDTYVSRLEFLNNFDIDIHIMVFLRKRFRIQ